MNLGPPALEASTLSLGYRGCGTFGSTQLNVTILPIYQHTVSLLNYTINLLNVHNFGNFDRSPTWFSIGFCMRENYIVKILLINVSNMVSHKLL